MKTVGIIPIKSTSSRIESKNIKILANNKTDGNLLLENEINNINSDIYLQVLATSPFINKNTIISIIELMKNKKY